MAYEDYLALASIVAIRALINGRRRTPGHVSAIHKEGKIYGDDSVTHCCCPGDVSDASTAGFTVVASSGSRVPATTSGDMVVLVLNASLDQLRVGADNAITTALVSGG
jgi:hypothetical protein